MHLNYIASDIERILNEPFAKGGKVRGMDIFKAHEVADAKELGKLVYNDFLPDFVEECSDSLKGMFSREFDKPTLRVSALGKHPLLQVFTKLGFSDGGMTNFNLAMQGHLFEATTRFILRCRGFKILYDNGFYSNEVEWNGVKGHPDFVIETPAGRRIVCECKHVSSSFLNGFLEPEKVLNEATGNMVLTGQNSSRLSSAADNNDYRGYLEQLSVYSEALGYEALWIFWDKERNRYHVVPLDPFTRDLTLAKLETLIPKIRGCNSVREAVETFGIPEAQPQMSRNKPTGMYYVPLVFRDTVWAELFYRKVYVNVSGGKSQYFVVRGETCSLDELLERGRLLFGNNWQ
ncbi:hypothetical protein BLD44_028490 [Mastigocladus laminosus UU774]|nr:hypothetical protein BLD44_028490 [Mastigocladus laminosus UU774]